MLSHPRKIGIMFLIVASALVFSPAMAADSPALSVSPPIFPLGTSPTMIISADPSGVTVPHFVTDVRVYDPVNTPPAPVCTPISGPTGVLPGPTVVGANVWELTTSGGTKVNLIVTAGSSISIPFIAGPFALPAPPGVTIIPVAALYIWTSVPALGPASTSTLGTGFFLVCGRDLSTIDSGGIPMGSFTAYTVTPPVAGEILPIDTAALLIAGATQNTTWVLASLAVIGAVSFTMLRFSVVRKSN